MTTDNGKIPVAPAAQPFPAGTILTDEQIEIKPDKVIDLRKPDDAASGASATALKNRRDRRLTFNSRPLNSFVTLGLLAWAQAPP